MRAGWREPRGRRAKHAARLKEPAGRSKHQAGVAGSLICPAASPLACCRWWRAHLQQLQLLGGQLSLVHAHPAAQAARHLQFGEARARAGEVQAGRAMGNACWAASWPEQG